MAATPRPPHRRRQRSVRVSVAVALLSGATALVLLSLPTGSPLVMGLASVTAMALSWAALRMMWTEVLQSRRENSADRAAAAIAYRDLFAARAADHAELTTAMTERLAQANLDRRQLQGIVEREQSRAAAAEARVVELEATRRDPDVVELADWDAASARRPVPARRQA